MLKIKPGEHGPRVVLLQIMLNRAGETLVADGIFGPKTKAAVIRFQSDLGRTAEGVVRPETWVGLVRDQPEVVVDVVDIGDPNLMPYAQQFRESGSDPILLGGMCNGIEQMVNEVIQKAGGYGSISLLRITGHGNHGQWMTVSVGKVTNLKGLKYQEVADEFLSYVSPEHFDKTAPFLSRLKPYFAPFGSMEHKGCSLGSVPATRKMMGQLSNLWDVPVSAGVAIQHVAMSFEGRVYTAYPRGHSLSTWSKQFQHMSI